MLSQNQIIINRCSNYSNFTFVLTKHFSRFVSFKIENSKKKLKNDIRQIGH